MPEWTTVLNNYFPDWTTVLNNYVPEWKTVLNNYVPEWTTVLNYVPECATLARPKTMFPRVSIVIIETT